MARFFRKFFSCWEVLEHVTTVIMNYNDDIDEDSHDYLFQIVSPCTLVTSYAENNHDKKESFYVSTLHYHL